ncbi:MAG: hypothetical protein Q7R30_23335 [Acidobacteriota bacterium]|nr:hypothetical protein [Acidobacteriota bacterium]
MNAEHDRDRALDQALKATLGRGADAPITPACLDAETLAAWMDGGLDAQSVAMAEAHAANCARCQALIGTLARATPEVAANSASPVRLWRWWLAPLAAGAAAVTLWMVVPADRYSAPLQKKEIQVAPESPPAPARDAVAPAPADLKNAAPSAGKDQPVPGKLADSAARANSATGTAAFDESKRKAEALMKADTAAERRDRAEPRALEEQGAAKAAAPAPPAAAPAIGQLRAQVALPSGVQITSTSSPSPTTTWFVGRAGVVLLTIDGKTVTRLPFPETTDLTAITATDARVAVVTTIDGRIFRTDDGGKTWRRSAEL